MPARPGQPFQPVIPGTGRVRKVAAPVTPEPPPAWNDRRRWTGPQPGQLVMGVTDLAHEQMTRNIFGGGHAPKGFMEVDPHGYVQEGNGKPMNDHEAGDQAAYHYYGTHGGRYAKTMQESLDQEGYGSTPSDMGMDYGDVLDHDRQVKQVKSHWRSMPTVHFPTSSLVHSTQGVGETEGDGEYRTTSRPRKEHGPNSQGRPGLGELQTMRTQGGSPVMGDHYTEVPGSGEGRKRVEAIKRDLEKGGSIRKPIWMLKVNGRHFQLDGHHRMVAAREAGQSHVPVKLWDLDAERAGAKAQPPQHLLDYAVGKNPALAQHLNTSDRLAMMQAGMRQR